MAGPRMTLQGGPRRGKSGVGISLKGRALRLLAGREQSRAELQKKLSPHAETPEQLTQVLDELEAKDFISEARVVDSVVNRRSGRFGASRIKHELLGKGLNPERVAEAVSQLKGSELERAREIWRKKFAEHATDQAGRAKQMRFLAGRGFGGDVIRRVMAGGDDD